MKRLKNFRIILLIVLIQLSAQLFVSAQELRIIHLDVGQGAGVYVDVIYPNETISRLNSRVLIDAGDKRSKSKAFMEQLRDFARRTGNLNDKTSHVQYVIASHYDKDHVGGLIKKSNTTNAWSGLFEFANIHRAANDPERFTLGTLYDLGNLPSIFSSYSNNNTYTAYKDLADQLVANNVLTRKIAPLNKNNPIQLANFMMGTDRIIVEMMFLTRNLRTASGQHLNFGTPSFDFGETIFTTDNPNMLSISTFIRVKCIPQSGPEKILYTYLNVGDLESRYYECSQLGDYPCDDTAGDEVVCVQNDLTSALIKDLAELIGPSKQIDLMTAGHHASGKSFTPYQHSLFKGIEVIEENVGNGKKRKTVKVRTEENTDDNLKQKVKHVISQSGPGNNYNHPRTGTLLVYTKANGATVHVVDTDRNNTKQEKEICDTNNNLFFLPALANGTKLNDMKRPAKAKVEVKSDCKATIRISFQSAPINTLPYAELPKGVVQYDNN